MTSRPGVPGRVLWWLRPAALAVLFGFVAGARPHPGTSGRGLLIGLSMLVTAVAWAVALWMDRRRGTSPTPALLVAGVAGVLLALASPSGQAAAFPFIAAGVAGALLPLGSGLYVAAAAAATFVIGILAEGTADSLKNLAWIVPLLGLITVSGAARRSFVERAEQAELLLAQAERASAAEARTAALAERARIARDLHDVLAHSVAALAMQLEAADALLTGGQVDRAHETVLRARDLARSGLEETRRAVSALRADDNPLPVALRDLASGHGASVTVDGPPREVPPEVRDALYRAAQESFTNAHKHAPGTAVRVRLRFDPDEVTVTVTNEPACGGPTPLAHTGAGLGLIGMRERAAALGGTVEAGPVEAGPVEGDWSVRVTIPA
jgi:signal transduction histidine kinase